MAAGPAGGRVTGAFRGRRQTKGPSTARLTGVCYSGEQLDGSRSGGHGGGGGEDGEEGGKRMSIELYVNYCEPWKKSKLSRTVPYSGFILAYISKVIDVEQKE